MYDRIMRPFRMLSTAKRDPRFAVLVIGHRNPFTAAVETAAAPSWFLFLFHHPVIISEDGGERRLPAGSAVLAAPGERIHHRPAGGRMDRSWLRCEGSLVATAVAEAGLPRRRGLILTPPDGALDALLALHRASVHPRGARPGLLLALFRALLHVVARDAAEGAPGLAGLEAVRRHLEASYMQRPRLDALAAMAGCSRAQFCRRFRAALGCSPGRYILRLRLEAAREQLLSTARPIAEIATDCGFSDRFHFSRAFARHLGSPPATLRRSGSLSPT